MSGTSTVVAAVVLAVMVTLLVTVSLFKQHYESKYLSSISKLSTSSISSAKDDILADVVETETTTLGSNPRDEAVITKLGLELGEKTEEIENLKVSLNKMRLENEKKASSVSLITATQQSPRVVDTATGQMWSDPLDGHKYSAESTGFIGKPLTVEDAELCDSSKTALLSPAWLWCPQDKTCRKCARHWDRNTELVASFRHDDERAIRKKFFDTYRGVEFNTVVVQAVNFGQIHLWLNWVCSCDKAGIPARNFTVLVPADKGAERVIKEAGFKTVDMAWTKRLSSPIGTVYGGATNSISTGHSDINNALMLTGQELLDDGFHVLMLDVDFVWMQDPRPFLNEASRGRDVLAMLAPRWDAQGTANTGFVFMRNNFRTKILMHTIVNLMPIKTHSDQLLFNLVLRHYKLRQISFAALPNSLFPILASDLKTWNKQVGGWSKILTAHVVSASKEARLYNTEGIFYNSSCAIYDPDLWPCGPDPQNCWKNSKKPKYPTK